MAYTAWSVVFNETPSAAKWNQLGENDAGFKDGTNIDSGAITTAKIADDAVTADKLDWASTGAGGGIWWEELGRDTAGGSSTSMSVTSIPVRKYLKILIYVAGQASGGAPNLQFNGDTGNNYAARRVTDDAQSTDTSDDSIDIIGGLGTGVAIAESFVVNVASKEKLLIGQSVRIGGSGAATAPDKNRYIAGKWANTSDAITRVDLIDSSNFDSGSELVVLGHD